LLFHQLPCGGRGRHWWGKPFTLQTFIFALLVKAQVDSGVFHLSSLSLLRLSGIRTSLFSLRELLNFWFYHLWPLGAQNKRKFPHLLSVLCFYVVCNMALCSLWKDFGKILVGAAMPPPAAQLHRGHLHCLDGTRRAIMKSVPPCYPVGRTAVNLWLRALLEGTLN
jgi:hypothetical protein